MKIIKDFIKFKKVIKFNNFSLSFKNYTKSALLVLKMFQQLVRKWKLDIRENY